MKKNRTAAAKSQKAMKRHIKNNARKARAESLYEFNNTVAKVKAMQDYFKKQQEAKNPLIEEETVS